MLSLGCLDRSETEELVRSTTDSPMPEDLGERLYGKAEGLPLF